jgi:hypothetical protein
MKKMMLRNSKSKEFNKLDKAISSKIMGKVFQIIAQIPTADK